MATETYPKITIDPKICHGKPIIKGTRIMLVNILSLLAGGYNILEVQEYYPELTLEEIKESIQYAVKSIQEEEIILA